MPAASIPGPPLRCLLLAPVCGDTRFILKLWPETGGKSESSIVVTRTAHFRRHFAVHLSGHVSWWSPSYASWAELGRTISYFSGLSIVGLLCSIAEFLPRPHLRQSRAEDLPGLGHWLFFIAFYTIFANLPYWIASREFGFRPYGWFSLEYAAIGVVALFVARGIAAFLLFSAISADLIWGVCRSYYLTIAECLANVSAVHAFSSVRRQSAVAVVLLTLLMPLISMHLPTSSVRGIRRVRAVGFLISFVVLLAVSQCLLAVRRTGHFPNPLLWTNRFDGVQLSSTPVRLARIPSLTLVSWEVHAASIRESAERRSARAVPSALAEAERLAEFTTNRGGRSLPNVVLVLVESWGLATDSSVNDVIVQPYLRPDLLARYKVVRGTVPFSGATVAGEARELCGSSFGFRLLNALPAELQGCVPARLAALGYHDIALHGMDGQMFNRSSWYGKIGFQEQWFNDGFKQQGLPDCDGALVGTCDSSIAEWLGSRLEKHEDNPSFVHWVTLNSHLPVLVPSPLQNGVPCTPLQSLPPNSPLCSWYQLVANVHQSVSQAALRKLARPTVFVVVGDHAPPFADPALRGRFSETVVPYVLLVPRTEEQPLRQGTTDHSLAHFAVAARPTRQASPINGFR